MYKSRLNMGQKKKMCAYIVHSAAYKPYLIQALIKLKI